MQSVYHFQLKIDLKLNFSRVPAAKIAPMAGHKLTPMVHHDEDFSFEAIILS